MLTVEADKIKLIREASNKLKGTNEYNKYYMPIDCKINGRWNFIGWGVPVTNVSGKLRRFKSKTYLLINDSRYELLNVHKALLEIK